MCLFRTGMKMTPKMLLLLLLVSTCAAAPFSILDKGKIPHDNADIKDDVEEDDSVGMHIHEDKQIDKKVVEDHQFELNVHDEDSEVDDIMEHAQDGLRVQGDNQREGNFWWDDDDTLPTHWKSYAYTLMCNHPGSDSEKATKVKDEMKSDYPEHNWVVAIGHEDLGSAYISRGGTQKLWKNSCGKDMYVWSKPDSEFEKTKCTSKEREQVESIIHLAEETGTSAETIRDTIKSKLKVFGIPYHLIIVVEKSASVKKYTYKKCYIKHTSDKYNIIVFRDRD